MGLLGLVIAAACWRTGAAVCTPTSTDCKLRQVQIVFRHGDRSPVQHIAGLDSLDDGTNPWPGGLGQLTPRGMQEHFRLGQLFRQRYIDEWGLIDSEYNRSQVFVNSTDVERTLMSAESQLAGWFPTNATAQECPANGDRMTGCSPYTALGGPRWRPLPVHTTPKPFDFYIAEHQSDGVCPNLKTAYDTHTTRERWTDKLAERAPTAVCNKLVNTDTRDTNSSCTTEQAIAGLAAVLGIASTLRLENIWIASDTLYVRHQHDLEVPAVIANGTDTTVLDWVYRLSAWQMYDMYDGDLERRLSGGNLVKLLLANMDARFGRPSKLPRGAILTEDPAYPASMRRLILHSAHDTTLAALMKALDEHQFSINYAPPYASAIIAELYTDADGSYDSAYVHLYFEQIYKGQKGLNIPQLNLSVLNGWKYLPINGCNSPQQQRDNGCPLAQLSRILAPVTPDDWVRECGIKSRSLIERIEEEAGGYAVAFALLLTAVCLAGIALAARYYMKQKRLKNFAVLSPGMRYRIDDDSD